MELRHLRYFVAVAEELNFTRAAARLHVSQPPLSRQLKDLEDELGVVLLERSPQSVALTSAGRIFLKDARAILSLVDAAVVRVQARPQPKLEGRLMVGFAPSPTADLLPKVLAIFRKMAPEVEVELRDLSTEDQMAALLQRQMDLSFAAKPVLKAGSPLEFTQVFDQRIGLLVPLSHPLARSRSVSLEAIAAEPLVGFVKKGYADYHQWTLQAGKHVGRRFKTSIAVDGATSLIAAVEAGLGVAFIPEAAARQVRGRLKYLPIVPAAPPLEIGYTIRKGTASPVLEAFIQAMNTASAK